MVLPERRPSGGGVPVPRNRSHPRSQYAKPVGVRTSLTRVIVRSAHEDRGCRPACSTDTTAARCMETLAPRHESPETSSRPSDDVSPRCWVEPPAFSRPGPSLPSGGGPRRSARPGATGSGRRRVRSRGPRRGARRRARCWLWDCSDTCRSTLGPQVPLWLWSRWPRRLEGRLFKNRWIGHTRIARPHRRRPPVAALRGRRLQRARRRVRVGDESRRSAGWWRPSTPSCWRRARRPRRPG